MNESIVLQVTKYTSFSTVASLLLEVFGFFSSSYGLCLLELMYERTARCKEQVKVELSACCCVAAF